jgi:tetratricopeptide (TPR) repeat protein
MKPMWKAFCAFAFLTCSVGAPAVRARPQQSPGQRPAAPPANAPPGNASPGNSSPGNSGTPARSPDLLAPLVTQAQQALDRGDYDAAVELLKQILAQRPDEALPHFELGYAYSELKRNAEAAAEYRRALELNPSLVAAHLNLGLVLLASDPAAAVESFRRAAALAPAEPRPRYLAGQALERAGKPQDAIEEYNSGLSIAPRDQPLKFALARALLAAGRTADAESRFREAIALDPSGAVSAAPNRPAPAVSAVQNDAVSAAQNPAPGPAQNASANGAENPAPSAAGNFTAPAKLGLAETLLRENQTAAAADAFAAYLEAAPGDRAARFEHSVALQNLGRLPEALAELDRADAGVAPSADSLKLRASISMQQRDWISVGAALDKALAAAPRDAQLHAWQGHTQLELRNYTAAETELKRSLGLDPQPAEVLGDLVNVYYFSARYAEALAALDLLEKRQPLTAINWFFRAICFDKLRQAAGALAAYQKFLDLDHDSQPDQDFQARQRIKILQRELKGR